MVLIGIKSEAGTGRIVGVMQLFSKMKNQPPPPPLLPSVSSSPPKEHKSAEPTSAL